jgi:hypothetical protein
MVDLAVPESSACSALPPMGRFGSSIRRASSTLWGSSSLTEIHGGHSLLAEELNRTTRRSGTTNRNRSSGGLEG